MPPRKRRASLAPKPLKAPKALKALRSTKPLKALRSTQPPKAPQAWESYSQSFQATQYTHDSLGVVVIQPLEASAAVVLY